MNNVEIVYFLLGLVAFGNTCLIVALLMELDDRKERKIKRQKKLKVKTKKKPKAKKNKKKESIVIDDDDDIIIEDV